MGTRNYEAAPNTGIEAHWFDSPLSRMASGAGIALSGRIFGRFLFVLGQIVFARFLGPEEFGLYAIGWTMLQMGGMLAPIGLDKGVTRYASSIWQTDQAVLKGIIIQSLGMSAACGAIMAILLYLYAPIIAEDFYQNAGMTKVIQWFAPTFMLFSVTRVMAAITRVTQRMKYSVILEDLLPATVSLILFVVLYFLGYNLTAALGSAFVAYLLSVILGTFSLQRLFPQTFSRQTRAVWTTWALMTVSIPSWLAGAFSMFIIWANRLLVGYFRPEADVGIFQASSQISSLFALILGAITMVFSPMIADLFSRGKQKELQELFVISTKWGLYLSLPLFILVTTASDELLASLFGVEYQNGSFVLIILAIGQIVNIGSGPVGWILMMTGHHVKWFWITGVILCSSLVLNSLMTPSLGLIGSALATSFGLSMLTIIGLFVVRRNLGFWPYDKRYRKILLAGTVSFGVGLASRHLISLSPFPRLVLTAILVAAAFLLAMIPFGFDMEDVEFLRVIRTWASRLVIKDKHV